MSDKGSILGLLAVAAASCCTPPARAIPDFAAIGYTSLQQRLGPNTPTGAGVPLGQVEAFEATNAFMPDASASFFAGVQIIAQSWPWAVSSHATGVGAEYYGAWSMATGATRVHCWSASGFAFNNYLKSGTGLPLGPTIAGGVRVVNHSWVGFIAFPPGPSDNEILRRLDDAINRDDFLSCNGWAGANYWLLNASYNGLSVGLANGQWGGALSPPELDAPGRSIPQIVVPATSASSAVPVVSSAASLLFETARTAPNLAGNPDAQRALTVRAALLAGATKRPAWSNNPIASGPLRGVSLAPLDPVFGVDTLNVDRSHRVITGGEWPAALTTTGTRSPRAGWSLERIDAQQSRYWRFWLPSDASEAVFLVTWNRVLPATSPLYQSSVAADFSLTLWRLDDQLQQPIPLIGDAGAVQYNSGNISSRSPADNVELIRVLGLKRGRYMLELRRDDDLVAFPAWEAAVAWLIPEQPCPGDTNTDRWINFIDLNTVLSQFGQTAAPGTLAGDVNADGIVNFADLNIVLGGYGERC